MTLGPVAIIVDPDEIPVPRVFAFVQFDGEERTTGFAVGFEISSRHADAIVDVQGVVPWRRPRPWSAEGFWPRKSRSERDRFVWRRP